MFQSSIYNFHLVHLLLLRLHIWSMKFLSRIMWTERSTKNVLELARIQIGCIKICFCYWAIGRAKWIRQVQHLFSVGMRCKNCVTLIFWCEFNARTICRCLLVLVVMCQKTNALCVSSSNFKTFHMLEIWLQSIHVTYWCITSHKTVNLHCKLNEMQNRVLFRMHIKIR